MIVRYQIPLALLTQSFHELRSCGGGRRECQVVWLSPWHAPGVITEVIHTTHTASAAGFTVDESSLTVLWKRLADTQAGVRVQVHTHPGGAFHSSTDDSWPVIHTSGFLSLVIPNFGLGEIGFKGAYLAEIGPDGRWHTVDIVDRLEVVE